MLQDYFKQFRENIIGINQTFESPFGTQKIIYTDWTASGRMYQKIEDTLLQKFYPFVANTHTETTQTGSSMTVAYHKAQHIIKEHVNASNNEVLITCDAGMTGAINKFQRILGFRIHEKFKNQVTIPENERPIVFVTHMEHHSNQTSWLETIAEVVVINPTKDGLVDLEHLKELLQQYKNRTKKIAAITSCSNVTGIFTPYHQIAAIMHQNNGLCFVDFACSAPYINIDMNPKNADEKLDAIYFSPHKFLGGPGTSGVLIFDSNLYTNKIPDNPGGGTVEWTNPWGEHEYVANIEAREDGGTPGFLQVIRTALSIQLKNNMGVENMLKREHELLDMVWSELEEVSNLHILANNIKDRLSIVSFYIDDLHYNLAVKLLNDKFGIQTRGGCSCAGTYGHYLLNVDKDFSHSITSEISCGILDKKPGWVRMSLHPTTTNEELNFALEALKELAKNHKDWAKDYSYNSSTNEYKHVKEEKDLLYNTVNDWFNY
ncbi:MAG: aminotransferase class V-fold PLP-dependent enzyme [Flavobacteriales bacterium]|nr:aminotransferase class V-fold PLP-dependent enzyme [Flavobacteriales bacterium]MCB9175408.1 aminotransferase class V-fold PLP-dependent enzyme [Flavobacteriales bacterium]